MKLLYIDFETTGLDPKEGAAPIELAAILVQPNRELTEISRFDSGIMAVPPNAVISQEALNVNGISRDAIAAGVNPVLACKKFCLWLEKNLDYLPGEPPRQEKVMLAGQKVEFDVRFMEAWMSQEGIEWLFNDFFHHSKIDFKAAAWTALVPTGELSKTSLGDLTAYFGIPHVAHRAMSDVEAGVEVARRLVDISARGLKDLKLDNMVHRL